MNNNENEDENENGNEDENENEDEDGNENDNFKAYHYEKINQYPFCCPATACHGTGQDTGDIGVSRTACIEDS